VCVGANGGRGHLGGGGEGAYGIERGRGRIERDGKVERGIER
jgi:hypothetical protein